MAVSANKDKTGLIMFVLSLIFGFCFASSFLLMPAASSLSLNDGKNGLLYLAGAMFWISLVLAITTTVVVTVKRKNYFNGKDSSVLPKYPGIITFFSTKEAKIVDILMIVFIIAFIVCTIFADGYPIYIFLFLSVLAIQYHCVLNGKNLIYIKELKSGGRVL